jgi:hypothetical protein
MNKALVIFIILKGEKAIDGSSIFLLEEEDLREDIQIQSNIVRKKLLNWIKTILPQFG